MNSIVIDREGGSGSEDGFDVAPRTRGDTNILLDKPPPRRGQEYPAFQQRAPTIRPVKPMQQQQQFRQQRAPAAENYDDTLEAFANTNKMVQKKPFEDAESDGGFSSLGSDFGGEQLGGSQDGGDNQNNPFDDPDDEEEEKEPTDPAPPPIVPSAGFASIEQEKHSILYELQTFKGQEKYAALVPSYTVHSDILEMRASIATLKRRRAVEGTLAFEKRALSFVVSGIEHVSTQYHDVVGMELDGWSTKVCAQIESGEMNDVLAEIAEKWTKDGKGLMPPELRLLFMIGSSAAVHHLQRSMSKKIQSLAQPSFSAQIPAPQPRYTGGWPDAGEIMFNQSAAPMNFAGTMPAPSGQTFFNQPVPHQRPDITPPGFDMASILRPATTNFMPPPISTRPVHTVPQTPSEPPPAEPQPQEERADDAADVRSDVPSDDGQQFGGPASEIPDDLSSIISEIPMVPKRGRKRKGATPADETATTKRVIVI